MHAKTIGGFDNVTDLYLNLFSRKPDLLVFDENQWNIKANKDIYNIVRNEILNNYNEVFKTQTTRLFVRH